MKKNNNGHGMGWLAGTVKTLAKTLGLTTEWWIDRRWPERLDVTKPPFASANELARKTNGVARKTNAITISIEWPDDVEAARLDSEEFWRPSQLALIRNAAGAVSVVEKEEAGE